jgi:osmotically-inducible protein OsmY
MLPVAVALTALLALAAPAPPRSGRPAPDDAALAEAVRHAIEHGAHDAGSARAAQRARRLDLVLARDVLDAIAGTGVTGAVVSVADGAVELRGRVPDAVQAARAVEAASAVPGVRALHDRLSIEGAADRLDRVHVPSPSPEPVGPVAGDTAGAGAAAGAGLGPFSFLTPGGLAGRDLHLTVRDGIADMTGRVNAAAARHHAIVAAQSVHGVRAVRAALDVRAGDPVDDERLATLVRRRLEYDPVVQAVMPAVIVRCRHGVVRLEGLVRDAEQRRRAVALVAMEAAVFAVVDGLAVDPGLVVPASR